MQAELDRVTGESYVASLKPSTPELSAAEPVHQLFHNRLVTPPNIEKLGGRVARFYEEQLVELPTGNLSWEHFKALHWRINGIDYSRTIDELFNDSLARLSPATIAKCGGVIAHGDAHNANVWVERRDERSRLVLFDPAFAGEHVPSLLADVKATFHNIFAHPFWLYHPAEADDRFHVDVSLAGDCLVVEHDWKLASPRREFLAMKIELIWRPLLAALRDRGLLTTDWRRVVRLALFCCPTLVMSLRAGASHGATVGRSPKISALSFAIAVMAGCEPQRGADLFSTLPRRNRALELGEAWKNCVGEACESARRDHLLHRCDVLGEAPVAIVVGDTLADQRMRFRRAKATTSAAAGNPNPAPRR